MAAISFAITAHNEYRELERLLDFLNSHIRAEDEIMLQLDEGATPEVRRVAEKYNVGTKYEYHRIVFPLQGNFAQFKNNLTRHCTRPWVFQLDADEMPSEALMQTLPTILNENPTVELFLIPRINTVEGLTEEHIRKWGWRVDEKGWVNFPDYQTRIYQKSPKIAWASKVHEVITGHGSYAFLPAEEAYCLLHHKHIARQEAQNEYYKTISTAQ